MRCILAFLKWKFFFHPKVWKFETRVNTPRWSRFWRLESMKTQYMYITTPLNLDFHPKIWFLSYKNEKRPNLKISFCMFEAVSVLYLLKNKKSKNKIYRLSHRVSRRSPLKILNWLYFLNQVTLGQIIYQTLWGGHSLPKSITHDLGLRYRAWKWLWTLEVFITRLS